jgi:hypothetical protein
MPIFAITARLMKGAMDRQKINGGTHASIWIQVLLISQPESGGEKKS